ncbi:MAG: AlpA family phage regulatory protein [Castellaniella sp.]
MATETQTVLLDINAVKRQIGVRSTQTVYSKMANEGFPQPIAVGIRTKRWIAAEVESWIQQRIAESRC